MRQFISALAVIIAGNPLFAEVAQINWADLIDQGVQSYEDPFRDLSYEQIDGLRQVVKLQSELEGENPSADAAETLAEVKKSLSNEGVDADWLISQRWVVADRRKLAGEAGNPAKDGAIIKLAGFVIPAPASADGTPVAYLVPERGMCSHVPPPPPNQMVRLRLTNGWKPTEMYEPIVVTGQLQIQPSDERILVVDGSVSMRATFEMDVADVQTFSKNDVRQSVGTTDPSAATKAWAEGLAEKLKQSRQSQTENQ